ncbi:MAG: regulatory protein RecX [Acidobacteriota bacterium]
MPDEHNREVARALSLSLKTLSRKSRTRHEMVSILEKKGFSGDTISKSLAKLEDLGYIDDRNYAYNYAVSKATERLWGSRRIRVELGRRGISTEIVESILKRLKDEIDEESLLEKAIRKKLHLLRVDSSEKSYRRLYNYLMRRGFSASSVMERIRKWKVMDERDDEIG